MDQTLRLILDELEDRVEQIFAATEELREVVGDGKATRHLLDSIFRNVHSLKASASSNDLDDLSRIAHQFENLLHALRVGKTLMDDEVLRAFDDTCDALFASLRQTESANSQSYESLFERLQSLSETTARESRLDIDVILSLVPTEIWQALSEEEKHRLESAVGEGASLFLVATSFDLANFDQLFQRLKDKLTLQGEVISTAPKVRNERPDKIDFRILYTRESDLENVNRDLADLEDVTVSEIFPPPPITTSDDRQRKQPQSVSRSAENKPHLIRIDLDDLDRLISSTHQLFRETSSCFDQAFQDAPGSAALKTKVDSLSTSFMMLAAELVNLRMVPVDRVLQRAFRAGLSIASRAGKEIDFTVLGHDLKIDKALSDAISDPLIHLVRNAVVHGIESEAERSEAGKDRRGKISIEASTSQGQPIIKVTDDGCGIDPELVCGVGKRLGLLSEEARLDIDQSVRLIFRAGFSTASDVSETSGRGVGLDVVETAIEEVGGAIRVESESGVGSVFEMRLPVTFSLLDAVVVKEGNHRYLIDAAQIVSSQEMKPSQRGASELKINDETVALLRLDELLGLERAESEAPVLLLCSLEKQSSEQRRSLALQVNELLENEQVLVRNLGSRGGRWLGVAGAAEMRDGTVALLLDLPVLTAAAKSN